MGLIVLIIEVFLIVLLDKKLYKTYYTPSIMLSVPFVLICLLYDLNSTRLGLVPLNYDVLFIWVFGLFFFWLTGIIAFALVPGKPRILSISENMYELEKVSRKLLGFSFFLAIILTYFLYKAYTLYITQGGEAAEGFLGTGVHAHLVNYLKLLSIIAFLALFKKDHLFAKLRNVYIIFISLAISVMYGTKSGILLLFLIRE